MKKVYDILVEEEENEQNKTSLSESDKGTIQTALRAFNVLPPKTDDTNNYRNWHRNSPLSVITTPICTPSPTTIVSLSSLPEYQRSLYLHKKFGRDDNRDNDDDALVEIPIELVVPQPDGNASGNNAATSVQNRPLTGNLSSKLIEYTRGTVGSRNPFAVSGLMEDSKHDRKENLHQDDDNKKETYPIYCSPNEFETARDVLRKGSIEAWKSGELLTSPPGLSFKIGLGIDDVYENMQHVGSKGCNEAKQSEPEEDMDGEWKVEGDLENLLDGQTDRSNSTEMAKMWDKSFFDSDSLFANDSSSESSSSDDDSEINEEEEEEGKRHDEDDSMDDGKSDKEKINTDLGEGEYHNDEGDGIDDLLSELAMTTTSSEVDRILQARKKRSDNITNNPMHLIQKNKSKSDRKTWAVTTSLLLDDFHTVIPNPAITYPFELDTFQKQAVARLERGECIFVAAHTSAGKTVCAEYAIALARKHCTRAIYTSPIKALSNQKYRDFKDKFGDDVGLITGDMQINADSSCLIMTTEILRSMLYRGADLVRDIEWVIFDEVHYINDSERGVVWEEVIIMLPDYVNLIFLSATTPNTIDFSDWIGRTKRKPVHVIRTNYRPVPLSHHLYAGQKLHKVMEGRSGFSDTGWKKASMAMLPASERLKKEQSGKRGGPGAGGNKARNQQSTTPSFRKSGSKHSAWQQSGSRQDWTSLVKYLDREGLIPTVVFSFSKKKCEEIANMLRTLDLNTAAERSAAHSFANQTMQRLSPQDATLPQVTTTCEMVKRGIGVHHGGLLPILKEMVEILFSRNLIKVLFATETFAMGVNMPARAVVFNSIRKHDGTQFRVLEPGEYTQMAGRAGRRGLDKVGTVIICCFGDEPPPQLILKNMLTGSSTKLQSQFRLTYNMILNLLRVEDMSVEGMIKRSFSEFATQRALTNDEYPKLLARGMKALKKLDSNFQQDADTRIGAEDIQEYYSASTELLSLSKSTISYLLSTAGATGGGALAPGRILLVTAARKSGYVRVPALVVKAPTSVAAIGGNKPTSSKPLVCIVLQPRSYVPEKDLSTKNSKESHLNFIGCSSNRYYAIHEIELNEILFVTSIKKKVDTKEVYKEESPSLMGRSTSLQNQFSLSKSARPRHDDDGFGFAGMSSRSKKNTGRTDASSTSHRNQMDEIIKFLIEVEMQEERSLLEVMDLRECTKGVHQGDEALEFRSACTRLLGLVAFVRQYKSHYHPNIEKHYTLVERKETLRGTVKTLQHLLSNESLRLFPDFLQRKALLRTLNYTDKNDTVCVKGRVACEANTCEELIVTEMVFEGILNELEPAEIAAVLSALIFQESGDDESSELPERLANTCESMKQIAMNLGQLQLNHGIQIDPKEYCEGSLKFGLVHVVYEWALGVPFSNICELTSVQEGSIVRCITRLDELCREVRNCARVVGNPTLYRKMEEASTAIKRDIVFAASLYIS